jgi:hypothetical protein
MRLDIYQTLAAAIALGLLFIISRKEHFKDVVIPPTLSTRDAAAELLSNFQSEYRGYLLPAATAIEQLLELRPGAPVDRRLLQIRNLIRTIDKGRERPINKLMKSFDALPPKVDIYVNTYNSLIKIAGTEYDRLVSGITSDPLPPLQRMEAPKINVDQLSRNPTKTVNNYNHISNTRIELLSEQESKIEAARSDFEVVAARLRILLSQTK